MLDFYFLFPSLRQYILITVSFFFILSSCPPLSLALRSNYPPFSSEKSSNQGLLRTSSIAKSNKFRYNPSYKGFIRQPRRKKRISIAGDRVKNIHTPVLGTPHGTPANNHNIFPEDLAQTKGTSVIATSVLWVSMSLLIWFCCLWFLVSLIPWSLSFFSPSSSGFPKLQDQWPDGYIQFGLSVSLPSVCSGSYALSISSPRKPLLWCLIYAMIMLFFLSLHYLTLNEFF